MIISTRRINDMVYFVLFTPVVVLDVEVISFRLNMVIKSCLPTESKMVFSTEFWASGLHIFCIATSLELRVFDSST